MWLFVLPSAFLLYSWHIKCFYFNHSRDPFDSCADGFIQLQGWCYKHEMFSFGFLRVKFPHVPTFHLNQLLCNTVFLCPENKGSLLRICLWQHSLHAQGGASYWVMCPVMLLNDKNQVEALILWHHIGTKLVSSVVKRTAVVCSPRETDGKNECPCSF